MARGGGNKKIFQYCNDSSGDILCLRARQGHSGRNPIDPSLQDNVLIPNDFFFSHRKCDQFTLHHEFRIDTRRTKFEQKTDSILHACGPTNKEHRDPSNIDLEHHVLHGTSRKWKKHQNTVYWVDIELAQEKGLMFYQTRSNAMILYDTLPAYCIPKVVMMETGEMIYEKVYASPRPPPMISFKDNWMKELGSEIARGSEDSQQIQPTSKTLLSSTVRLVKSEQPSGLLAQEIEKDVLFGCECTNVSTGRPVYSCVRVSVECLDQNKDADENVDTDQIGTGRLVKSGQSIGLFSQR